MLHDQHGKFQSDDVPLFSLDRCFNADMSCIPCALCLAPTLAKSILVEYAVQPDRQLGLPKQCSTSTGAPSSYNCVVIHLGPVLLLPA